MTPETKEQVTLSVISAVLMVATIGIAMWVQRKASQPDFDQAVKYYLYQNNLLPTPKPADPDAYVWRQFYRELSWLEHGYGG